MNATTPFPFDPPPGSSARGAAGGSPLSARAGMQGAAGGQDDPNGFAGLLLRIQEGENETGQAQAPGAQAGVPGEAQAVPAPANGGAPHEVSQFLARLFAGEHPDQPALGKAFAPGRAENAEGAPSTEALTGLQPDAPGEILAVADTTLGETPAPEGNAGPLPDPAIAAAILGEGEAMPQLSPEAAAGEDGNQATATEADTGPAVAGANSLPDGADGETAGAGGSEPADAEKAGLASGEPASGAAPQSEAARASNAAHLPPLPENAAARAQAMARPQFGAEAAAGDESASEGGEKTSRLDGAPGSAASAAAPRNAAAARPAQPVPQPAALLQPAPPSAGLAGQVADEAAALAAAGSAQPSGQGAQAGAATQLASTYSPTATLPLAQLALQIAARARAGHSRFEIRIDPPELGRVDVRLDMGRDGSVTTRMVVERAETLDLLQRDARALERALGEAGLDAQEGSLQFSLKGEGFGRGKEEDGGKPRQARDEAANELSGELRAAESRYRPARASERALDIRV